MKKNVSSQKILLIATKTSDKVRRNKNPWNMCCQTILIRSCQVSQRTNFSTCSSRIIKISLSHFSTTANSLFSFNSVDLALNPWQTSLPQFWADKQLDYLMANLEIIPLHFSFILFGTVFHTLKHHGAKVSLVCQRSQDPGCNGGIFLRLLWISWRPHVSGK